MARRQKVTSKVALDNAANASTAARASTETYRALCSEAGA